MTKKVALFSLLLLLVAGFWHLRNTRKEPRPKDQLAVIEQNEYDDILSYEVNLKEQKIAFFSTDSLGNHFENHGNLKRWLNTDSIELVFAVNGGMYRQDLSPQGLYIENGSEKAALDTIANGYGNFYLQPNGVFWIKENQEGMVSATSEFLSTVNRDKITYATQSGPMLLIDGNIHPAFNAGSSNVHIRNGVGILPNGNLLFAISKKKVNFYHFAQFFLYNQCQNALYLDGFVSRMYLPAQNWQQEDGKFGIIIAEIKTLH